MAVGVRRRRLRTRARIGRFVVFAVLLLVPVFAASASADDSVTFTGTQVIPVPPASNFAGQGGGDGWGIALSPDAQYNVFHHDSELVVACHKQIDASPCWAPIVLRQPDGDGSFGFSSSGQPGLYLDPNTGKLYVYATRDDGTGGVVCFDTTAVGTQTGPFCGFTALTGPDESVGADDTSGISDPVQIGSKWYAFNYFSDGTNGAENKVLCFDLVTDAACANQPYAVQMSEGTVSVGTFPSPATAAMAGRMFIPITIDGRDELDCFDPSTADGTCAGWEPVAIGSGSSYVSRAGAPFPLMNPSGIVTGVCLPTYDVPCYDLSGNSVATPAGLVDAISPPSDGWNGPALVIGPRIYVPNGNTNNVRCFDYNIGAQCANFPHALPGLGYLYTVNADPQRPTCIWVNADNGSSQIQNFDAFTGGACGQGPIRVLASSFVVSAPRCTPGRYASLQVTQPAPGTYQSGTVAFQDPSGNPIPGADAVPLDANGVADLTTLDLNTDAGLPQFLITLDTGDNAKPQQVVVKLTWQGAFDPSCATPISTIVNPPANTPPAAGPPPQSDVSVSAAGPSYVRAGGNITFVDMIENGGKDTATGVELTSPIPAGTTFVSATLSNGNDCTASTSTGKITCFVGTLASGSSATVAIVVATTGAGTVTQSAAVQGDYDTNPANNTASATTSVIPQDAAPPAPPKPAQPGTFNAIATGTVTIDGQPVTPDQVVVVHAGDTVDVTNGTITITDFDGGFGTFGNLQPSPQRRAQSLGSSAAAGTISAAFRIDQPAQAGAGVTLTLVQGDFSVCGSPRRLSGKNQTPVRQLWGKAHGLFTTQGRYSAATIRGTIWLEQDRCDGTLTTAVDDVVTVDDLVKSTTVTLQPGQSYLAQPKQTAFKPPTVKRHQSTKTQTPASIRERGLTWAHELFVSEAQFKTWLERHGETWQHFAVKNPTLAEALAGRE